MTNDTIPSAENGASENNGAAMLIAAIADTTATSSDLTSEPAEPKPPSFDDLGLHPDVKQALDDMGYFTPTPVQTAVFAPVTAGKDLLVQSRTGTGKTAAFGLPLINRIVPAHRHPQALILAPTRELALQVARELTQLGKHRGVVVEAIYGGAPIGKQISALKDGVHIIVGTPGRVLDHIGRRTLDCKTISTFVLDECDEMLSMGFLEDIERVTSYLPDKHQTLLFSATMPQEVERYARRHMKTAENLSLSRDSTTVTDIHHEYFIVSGIARTRDLLKVILLENPDSAIIFCNMRNETTMIAKFLQKQGLDAEPLSSDLSQADRERVMARTKAKNLRFLVATDVAARGIDISNLSHVINFTVPESPEIYVHRTGRTGRAGKKGVAISLVGPRELGNFRFIRLTFGIKPEEKVIPKDDIFIGKLKVPLPALGSPTPPDPVQILIRGVPQTPSDLERQIFEKLYTTANGKRVLAQLVAEKLNTLSTRTAPRRRPERDEAAAGSVAQPVETGERPRFADGERGPREDRGERRFDRDRERPRFGDGERGPREDRERRPRFGEGPREDRGERRFDREDRGPREDRPREDRPREDRPRDERPRDERPREDRPREDRPREDRPRDERPREDRGPREDRPRDERPREDRGERRFDRDRDRGERRFDRDRDRRPERTAEAPVAEVAQDTTAPAAVIEGATANEATTEQRPVRHERDHRGDRDRDRDRHDRRDRQDQRDRGEHRAEAAPAPAAVEESPASEQPTQTVKIDEVAQAALDRADRGKRRDQKKSAPTEATREFWETWADNKAPAPTPVAAPAEAAAEAPAEADEPHERKSAKGGKRDDKRGRGRDRKDHKDDKPVKAAKHDDDDKPSRAKKDDAPRGKRDTVVMSAAAAAADGSQARLFVNLGKKHGVSADQLRALLAAPIGGDTARIGSVSLRDSHAHVRVPEELVDAIIAGVHGTSHKEQTVTVERARA
ncbi:MAG TPA: DEAD/DEAH box helicase [Kofleriaceae bacterium]|nr:DEAD/DEAH box helicase [Kofleriaceae bacterium]